MSGIVLATSLNCVTPPSLLQSPVIDAANSSFLGAASFTYLMGAGGGQDTTNNLSNNSLSDNDILKFLPEICLRAFV